MIDRRAEDSQHGFRIGDALHSWNGVEVGELLAQRHLQALRP